MDGSFALPHQPLRGTASGSPHQHRNLSELAHAASPTMRTSGSSTTPVVSRNGVAHVLDQGFDVGRLRRAFRIDDEIGVLVGNARAADRIVP